MYKYRIGAHEEDIEFGYELYHKKKFTEKEIIDFVVEAIENLFPEYYANEIEEISNLSDSNLSSFLSKPNLTLIEFFWGKRDCESSVCQWLVENKGFRFVEYEVDINMYGRVNLLDDKECRRALKNRSPDSEAHKVIRKLLSRGNIRKSKI